jgi:hypothetical protein
VGPSRPRGSKKLPGIDARILELPPRVLEGLGLVEHLGEADRQVDRHGRRGVPLVGDGQLEPAHFPDRGAACGRVARRPNAAEALTWAEGVLVNDRTNTRWVHGRATRHAENSLPCAVVRRGGQPSASEPTVAFEPADGPPRDLPAHTVADTALERPIRTCGCSPDAPLPASTSSNRFPRTAAEWGF